MSEYENKVVMVTGTSSGIGEEIAKRFYEEGAYVAQCSRDKTRVDNSVKLYASPDDPRIYTMTADMTKIDDILNFAKNTIKHFGRIDILVNNAGLSCPKPSIEVTEEDWEKTVNTKLRGYFFMTQAVVKDMLSRKEKGIIINIGSVQSATVVIGQAVYSSVNAAICQMTRSFGSEWGKSGIRINCIAPGSIQTNENKAKYADPVINAAMCEKIPLGYRGNVSEIAELALFLASEKSSYITGQTIYADGGLSLIQG